MRNKIIISLIALFTLASTALAANPISLYVNGKLIQPTVAPIIVDGTTLVPLRVISEALGADVQWDGATQRVTVSMPQTVTQGPETLSLAELNEIGSSVGVIYAYANDKYVGQGSGFVVDGVLVTNWHVLDQGVTRFVVSFGKSEETFQVQDAAFKNEDADLIGFKISGYPSLKLSVDEPVKGETVYALGFPGNRFTISEGHVKVNVPMAGFLTHTATTDHGHSGGILINTQGNVVGITDSVNEDTKDNYAILASVLQDELNKIK